MAENLEYTIGVEVQRAVRSLATFAGVVKDLAPAVEKLRGNLAGMERASSGGGSGLASMASGLRSLLGPLAAAATLYAGVHFATDQFKASIDRAAEFEQLKVGFTVLLQSGAKAKTMLADLSHFADTTPFHMPELAQAARTLLAFGDPAKNVMRDLRELGDVAAGVQAPIGEIAELFGKARTEGTLFSIDIRELTRRGIPIIGELAKQFHVSENAIHGMAETGRIKFADLQMAISNLTSKGGMFFGMLAAQGQTFNGMVTTMQDALGALYREFGTPILEPLKSGVGEITAILAGWKDKAREWGATLSNVLKGAMAIIQNGDAGTGLVAALQLGFAEAVNVLYKGSRGVISALITGLGEGANVLIQALSKGSVWKLVGDALAVAAYTFVGILQQGIADAIRGIPGMGDTAEGIDAAAGASMMQAKSAQQDVQKDLKNSDVKAVFAAAVEAAKDMAEAFRKAYEGAASPLDTAGPKSTLAGVVNRANARTNPLLYTVDNEGNPYGAGAPYGSPDSQMPKPGTPPSAADLATGLRNLVAGVSGAAPAPDAGPGTINGLPAAAVVRGPSAPATPWTLPPLTLPATNLNARAQALVGGGRSTQASPQLGAIHATLGGILTVLQASQPKPQVAGSGL